MVGIGATSSFEEMAELDNGAPIMPETAAKAFPAAAW